MERNVENYKQVWSALHEAKKAKSIYTEKVSQLDALISDILLTRDTDHLPEFNQIREFTKALYSDVRHVEQMNLVRWENEIMAELIKTTQES